MKSTRESLWAVEPGDRPREKLQRLGPAGLTDAELVALVLGSGVRGVNVLDSAASLLAQAGGVPELMAMTVRELRALMGVGIATAGRVVAVSELWRRVYDPLPGTLIEHPGDLVEVVRAFLALRAGDASGATAMFVVVADDELRVRVVVPLAHGPSEGIHTLVPRVLHEVLYRGGSAFALALVSEGAARAGSRDDLGMVDSRDDVGRVVSRDDVELVDSRDDLAALRDVLKLAASTIGLRYLSTVVIGADEWRTID